VHVVDVALAEQDLAAPALTRLRRLWRTGAGLALLALVAGNGAALVWLWWHGGNVTRVHTEGDAVTSVARITGLEGAYLALVAVVLLARLPALERLVGLDRLSRWHRWNGHVCVDLVIAHVVLSVWGYSLLDRVGIGTEIGRLLGGGNYPGMIVATVGTGLWIAVGWTSFVVARRRLSYEWWYAIHLTAYAAIALAWFHEIPTGNELVLDPTAADYWRALFAATLAVLVAFRLVVPIAAALSFRLRVVEVTREADDVVSIVISGRRLDRLRVDAGQFFLWRFLDRKRWWKAHPFSLSAAPDGRSLRITVKALGDDTARLGEVRPGTRVLAEGPFGVFTEAARRRNKVLLIAGGIGITPIRALLETMQGDLAVVYRILSDDHVIFRDELSALQAARGAALHIVAGDHLGEGRDLLSADHLRELVPDLDEREVYLCGPAAMTAVIERNLRAARVERRRVHVERFALT
jgi:predicted ferric reductase